MMTTYNSQDVSPHVFDQLQVLGESRFTGRADVRSSRGLVSSFYFCLGRLVWFANGHHPTERWYRLLARHCPKVEDLTHFQARYSYGELARWLHRGQIKREHMVSLIEAALSEILFDLIQEQEQIQQSEGSTQTVPFDLYTDSEDTVDSPMTMVRLESVVENAHSSWRTWKNSGLTMYSPNLVPVIRRQALLRSQTDLQTYDYLSSLTDKGQTLRHLAQRTQQDPAVLTQRLLPYVSKGLISLEAFSPANEPALPPASVDPLPASPRESNAASVSDPGVAAPLVVCIDDSPHVCRTLEHILTQSHYRFVAITDAMQAIPMLLKLKPSLVFLDLVMPVVNGYELCSQIRRISSLKHIPVIILTGNDGLVDRVRAKWVGCTEFLPKPVDSSIVVTIVNRCLRTATPF